MRESWKMWLSVKKNNVVVEDTPLKDNDLNLMQNIYVKVVSVLEQSQGTTPNPHVRVDITLKEMKSLGDDSHIKETYEVVCGERYISLSPRSSTRHNGRSMLIYPMFV